MQHLRSLGAGQRNKQFRFLRVAISPAAAGLALPVSVTTSVKRLMCGSDGDECAAWGGASND